MKLHYLAATLVSGLALAMPVNAQNAAPTDAIKPIAEEALLYGLPMSMIYKIMYQYAIDEGGSQFKAPF